AVNTSSAIIDANRDFDTQFGDALKDMSGEQAQQLKHKFFAQRGLSGGQILKNSLVDTATGVVAGAIGARLGQTSDLSVGMRQKIASYGAEGAADLGIGVGASIIKGETSTNAMISQVAASVSGSI